ncbi:hypothetical protein L486_07798 [Kwoniella mangroviensis CBS 10435]|uniref:Uncharacterized protein n=1 Tax=Kwoniella mangroviensis CBS 10435 TaxID=1331196 RepID=A0A1B9IGE8_9TREE|nr:hypothetical protein L486_07798 [Kwoniella mangroviensis CBS 10435]
MDLTAMPWSIFELIPKEWQYSLIRAMRRFLRQDPMADLNGRSRVIWNEVASDSADIMKNISPIEGFEMLDLSAAPFNWFSRIPDEYVWALLRVTRDGLYRNSTGNRLSREERVQYGKDFERLVEDLSEFLPAHCNDQLLLRHGR